jgi:hypothetical protein
MGVVTVDTGRGAVRRRPGAGTPDPCSVDQPMSQSVQLSDFDAEDSTDTEPDCGCDGLDPDRLVCWSCFQVREERAA